MKFSKSKWLAYTFLVGLIPVLTRILTWITTASGIVSPFSAPDFIAFGLVLHVSVINELEYLPAKEKQWKTIQNGMSIIFVALYGSLYALTIIGEGKSNLIDATVILRSSFALAIVSSLLSLSVFHRLSNFKAK